MKKMLFPVFLTLMILILSSVGARLPEDDFFSIQIITEDNQKDVVDKISNKALFVSPTDKECEEGKSCSISFAVTNYGNKDGVMNVEAGIYARSSLEDWYGVNFLGQSIVAPFAGAVDTRNCKANEDFVETAKITLRAGETKPFKYIVKAPEEAASRDNYGIAVVAYERCYNPPTVTDSGMSFVAVERISITGDGSNTQSHTDRIKNLDETDIDCGGSTAPRCAEGYQCLKDTDCESGKLVCESYTEGGRKVCAVPLTPPPPPLLPPPPLPPVNDAGVGTFVGNPKISKNAIALNEQVKITQTLRVTKAGKIFVEAGTGLYDTFRPLSLSVAEVSANACDPDEHWFANAEQSFDIGDHEVVFTVIPSSEGKGAGIYKYWTDIVEECGGKTLSFTVGAETFTVGNPPPPAVESKKTSSLLIVGTAAVVIGIFLILPALWRRR